MLLRLAVKSCCPQIIIPASPCYMPSGRCPLLQQRSGKQESAIFGTKLIPFIVSTVEVVEIHISKDPVPPEMKSNSSGGRVDTHGQICRRSTRENSCDVPEQSRIGVVAVVRLTPSTLASEMSAKLTWALLRTRGGAAMAGACLRSGEVRDEMISLHPDDACICTRQVGQS